MENHHFYVFLLGKYGKPSINGQFSMGFFDFLVGCFKIQDTLTVQWTQHGAAERLGHERAMLRKRSWGSDVRWCKWKKKPYEYYSIILYSLYIYMVGGLEHGFYDFPFSWEFHIPNWRTHIFQRGRYTTNQIYMYSFKTHKPNSSPGEVCVNLTIWYMGTSPCTGIQTNGKDVVFSMLLRIMCESLNQKSQFFINFTLW